MMRIPSVTLTTLAFLALHLGLALAIPLVQDEAYYALWATVPSAGYYDHPPMIAWWIWAGEQLFGVNRFGVRVVSVLGFALVTPMVWQIARLLGGDRRAASLAALFYNLSIVILALGFTATPDAPSVFFWTASAWAILAVRQRGDGPAGWALAGVLMGLGVLSKFTNLFLGVGLAGWLLVTRDGRRVLRRPQPWLAALAALAVLGPFIWWNYSNGWIGLERQFGRIGTEGFQWRTLATYLVSILVLAGPVILWAAARGLGRPGAARTLLAWLMLPLPIYLAYHARSAEVAGNWLAPVYPLLAVFAGLGAGRMRAWVVRAAAAYGAGLTAVAMAVALWPGAPLVPGQVPPNQVKGWPASLRQIEAALGDTGAEWIATADYGLAGLLSFYLPEVPVWAVVELKRYRFRGPFPAGLCTRQAVLIHSQDAPGAFDPARLFRDVGPKREILRRSRGATVERYWLWPVRGPIAPGFEACVTPG